MDQIEEFNFRIRKFIGGIDAAPEEELKSLRRWLGRNEKRFMCILKHHFAHEERARFIEDCERDRCMVNWLKVFKYMNILGIQLELTVSGTYRWQALTGSDTESDSATRRGGSQRRRA